MTLTLILMRHAKSAWDDPHLTDHERPLNTRGHTAAKAMGEWMRGKGHLPDVAVSSDSTRTSQTAERLGFDVPVSFTRKLYLAGPAGMMEVLHNQTAPCVLMLGHNPGVADFADRLVTQPPHHPGFSAYPTGAVTVIRFDASTWNDIGWRNGQPIDFAVPREVMM